MASSRIIILPAAVKKMILNNRRFSIREVADDVAITFGSCQAILMDVLGMKIVTKLQIKKKKTMSHRHHSGDVDNVQRRSRFAQKGHKW